MKVWIKYLLGIALGMGAYIIIPQDVGETSRFVGILAEFAVRFGRYALVPLLLFGTAAAVHRLRSARTMFRTSLWTFALMFLFTFTLTAIGIASALLIRLPRIPITGERAEELPAVDINSLVIQLVPYSAFDALKDGAYLLPVFVLAAFVGAACASERDGARPVVAFVEAATRVFQNIAGFFAEWVSVGLIAISCWWLASSRAALASGVFGPLVALLAADFALFAVIFCPLLIRLVCRDPRPFHVLYASVAPVLAAFFSADSNLALLVNMRHGRESLGIRDEANSFSFPLFSAFCRGGTALVVSVCFVLIIRSYVDTGIRAEDVTWLFLAALGTSFTLCALPQGGTFVALSLVCAAYGRGFAEGYLLLRPAVPLLCSAAAAFDATAAIYGSYITAVKTRMIDHNAVKKYI